MSKISSTIKENIVNKNKLLTKKKKSKKVSRILLDECNIYTLH